MRVPRCSVFLLSVATIHLGCSQGPELPSEPREPPPVRSGLQQVEDPYAVRYNRTLIYPVQWGRAEDLAETLQQLYGSEAVIIPHLETNQLLIQVLPKEAQGRTMGPAAGRPETRQAVPRSSPQTTR